MNSRWRSYATADLAAQACCRQILSDLEQALAERPYATLAVSGGSTPKLLFQHMAASGFDWSRVHLFWVDERTVPPDSPDSNYRLAAENLLRPAGFPEANVHRIHGELAPDAAAERYVAEIRQTFGLSADALPPFDVIHLGMGADGHTASLFPGEPLIEDRTGIAAAVYVKKMETWRVTLLPGVLLNAGSVRILAAGADKADRLRQVLEGPVDPLQLPVQIAARLRPDAHWSLDEAAAARIAG